MHLYLVPYTDELIPVLRGDLFFLGIRWQKLSNSILAHNLLFKDIIEGLTPGAKDLEIFNQRKRTCADLRAVCH